MFPRLVPNPNSPPASIKKLFNNRKKIEKIIQNMDFKIVKRNKSNKSYIPDLLKKKYFLNSVFKYKLNK